MQGLGACRPHGLTYPKWYELQAYVNRIAHSSVWKSLEASGPLGHTYREQFIEGGGEEFYVAPCVNSHPEWVKALAEIIKGHMAHSV